MPTPSGGRVAGWLLAMAAALGGGGADAGPPAPKRTDLVIDLPAAGDLAAPANGQTLYVLDESRGGVVAIDPFDPSKRWTALAERPAADGAVEAVAIGCIDTGMLAVVGRGRDDWSLHTHRLQPNTASDPASPAQTVSLGRSGGRPPAAGDGAGPCLAVSPSRDWLGIGGLPAPLPAVVRAPIAGSRIGPVTSRGGPELAGGIRPRAITISTSEELVLFASGAAPSPTLFVAYQRPPDPRLLLHLDTGLPRIRDAAFCRADGTLWVVGGGGGGGDAAAAADRTPEGLWRIDAVLRNGRQAAEAVCVAPLPGARAVVCLSEKAIIVTHGREARKVSRFDASTPGTQPGATPGTQP